MTTLDELRRSLLETADAHGAAVVHVPEEEGAAPFAFSAGAWRRYGAPETVVIGLPPEVSHDVINTYVKRVGDGERFALGGLYDGFLQNCPVTFERVHLGYYPEYFGSAFLLYRDGNFPAMQILVCTPDGAFPWHPNAPGGFAQWQPVLTESGLPESWQPGVDGP